MTSPIVLADLSSLPLDDRRELPDTPAIYFVLTGDPVLYVARTERCA